MIYLFMSKCRRSLLPKNPLNLRNLTFFKIYRYSTNLINFKNPLIKQNVIYLRQLLDFYLQAISLF